MRKSILFFLFASIYLNSDAQLISDSFLIDNHYRVFHFNTPVDNKTTLIFILHGSGGNGEGMIKKAAQLESIAGKENLLLVYPDGYKRYWNECRKMATSLANIENIDDNAFFNKMIEYFISKYRINSHQVFAIGTSGGGQMAYKLAITMPEKFKAITSIIANIPEKSNMDCIEKKGPISVMIINGTADSTNPYNGGEMKVGGVVWGKVLSSEQSFKYWATIDGYKGSPKKESLPDIDPEDGKTIEKFSYQMKGKPEVVLLKVINGKHDYPNDIDVYLESWRFFKRQIGLK